jgi:hypothetical protein
MLYLLRVDGLLGVVDFSASVEWEVVDLEKGLCFWSWVEKGGSHYFGFFWSA